MEKRKINIYLIRHGETDWNKIRRLQGLRNIPLNENGVKQAEKIAEILKDTKIDCVYTSNLDRAIQTADVIAKAKDLEVEQVDNLREIDFGDEEGHTIEEIIEKYGMEFYDKFSHSADHMERSYDNGETKKAASERIFNVLSKIFNDTNHNSIAIVTHGFIIKLFLKFTEMVALSVKNCCVIHCEYDGKDLVGIESLN
ncbi:MAG: histidine phosphatase family protein [Rickettsiales bacterium]|jgi:broad specificity phosphatase PhoE|nr:histidine phosphatase family protein [Rickettsiales bacterium]